MSMKSSNSSSVPGADFGAGAGGAGKLVGVGPGVEGDGVEDVGDGGIGGDEAEELSKGGEDLGVVEVGQVVEHAEDVGGGGHDDAGQRLLLLLRVAEGTAGS